MKIYTKTGDDGTTSLCNDVRVPKDDIRIEVNGQIDELDSLLGAVVSFISAGDELTAEVRHIQKVLMLIMAAVAFAPEERNLERLEEEVKRLEKQIDSVSEDGLRRFVLPGGGDRAQALLHVARAKARTCERRLWTMNRTVAVNKNVIVYMNRLSDWLFAMAER